MLDCLLMETVEAKKSLTECSWRPVIHRLFPVNILKRSISIDARKTISRTEPKCSGKSQLQQYMHVFSSQINVIASYITPVGVTSDPSLGDGNFLHATEFTMPLRTII